LSQADWILNDTSPGCGEFLPLALALSDEIIESLLD
jgi:hypothetical protein